MNMPGFLLGLVLAAAGATGLVLWLRLAGVLQTAPDGPALGFEAGGAAGTVTLGDADDEFTYAGSERIGSSFGHRMLSLLGIIILVGVVGGLFALAMYEIGHIAVKTIQHFIQTSPTPLP